MANSLKEKLEKLLDDNDILLPTYCVLKNKLRTHDAEIRTKAIEEFAERMIIMMPGHRQDIMQIAESMKGEKEC